MPVAKPVAKPAARPAVGQFFTATGKPLDLAALVARAGNASYVLVGESHTSACDHQAQARILEALALGPNPPALGLEMVAEDQQPVLDAFNAKALPLTDLEARLNWKETWGHPFALYEPLFALAALHGLPLIGLNIPSGLVRKATREGLEALTPEERVHFPARIIPPPKDQEPLLLEVLTQHRTNGTKPSPERIQSFFRTQSAWDTKMAEMAAAWRKRTGRPMLVIAGSAHVENGWGIAHRLAVLDPGASVVLIAPWRGEDSRDPDAGDYHFYCPLTHKSRLGMVMEERGDRVTVTEVEPGSRADKAGARPGDVVVSALGQKVAVLGDLHQAGARAFKDKIPFVLEVDRQGQILTLDFGPLGQGK